MSKFATIRRVRSLVLPFALFAALASAGCATAHVSLDEGAREYVPFDYDGVLKRWTRTEDLVSVAEFDDILTVTSTFESWDFRWAYTVRYASDYRLSVEQRRVILESTLADARRAHQFYIALYGQNRRWNDLSRKGSAWIVRLIDEKGNESAPEQITSIPKPSAIERTYFPYTSAQRQVFRVRFPAQREDGAPTIAPDAKWFGLRFAGAQGNQDLVWFVEDGNAAPTSKVAEAPLAIQSRTR